MTVTVLLFASYADALGTASLDMELAHGVDGRATSLAASARCPAASDCRRAPLVAVNADATRRRDRVLRAGDEVAHHSAGGRRMTRVARLTRRSTSRRSSATSSTPRTARRSLFLGTVRDVNDGRAVDGHRLLRLRGDGEREMRRDRRTKPRAIRRIADVAVEHRLGDARASATSASRSPSRTRAPRAGARRQPLRDRGAQAPRADLEARALRGRHARVGRSDRRVRTSRRRT